MLVAGGQRCVVNTIYYIYSKVTPDDEWLIYSKHAEDRLFK
jgi:hypothetical protein